MSAAKGGAPKRADDLDDGSTLSDDERKGGGHWNARGYWVGDPDYDDQPGDDYRRSHRSAAIPATSTAALDAARKACAESAEVKAAEAATRDAWAAWSAAELALRTGPWPSREDANDAWDAERAARVLLERAWAARSSAYDRVIRGEPNR